jgi:transposase-like protein
MLTVESEERKQWKAICPRCRTTKKQAHNGKNPSGSLRARCGFCRKYYTPKPKRIGYERAKIEAVLYRYIRLWDEVNGFDNSPREATVYPLKDRIFRKVARIEGVNHQTAVNWINGWLESKKKLREYLKEV